MATPLSRKSPLNSARLDRRPLHPASRVEYQPLVTRPSTVIIGGGVAGLAAAWSLARAGYRDVVVLESESLTFSHSSARNAAIYRPLEVHGSTTKLAARSLELLAQLSPTAPLVDRCGLLLTAKSRSSLEALCQVANAHEVKHQVLDRSDIEQRCPPLAGGHSTCGLLLPAGGVLDIHALGERLRKCSRTLGVAIRVGTLVREIVVDGGRASGVLLDDGEQVWTDEVVIAAGAWSSALGASCGAPLPLIPHRRHLAHLSAGTTRQSEPIAWCLDSGVYFRREGDGYLACPGDHEAHAAGLPPVDGDKLELLATNLPALAPQLAGARVRRAWACLRTMAPDHQAVIGRDPRVERLTWLSGLGGFGMSGGLAAGELLAKTLLGQSDPLQHTLSPARRLLTPNEVRSNQSVEAETLRARQSA